MFFLLYRRADDAVFNKFPKISDHFPKISEDFPKLFRRPDKRFRTFSEDFRRFLKTAEDCRGRPKKIRCFDHTPTNSPNSTKAKGGNRDIIERYDTHKGEIRKILHSSPGWSGVWNLRVVQFPVKHSCLYNKYICIQPDQQQHVLLLCDLHFDQSKIRSD